jgi:glycosyltransferase involved in cell wall biosynthesis
MNILINELPFNESIILLIDKRIKNFSNINNFKHIYINNEFQRNIFLLANRKYILKLFSFGNVPPLIKIKGDTYVYFHQMLYLNKLVFNNKFNKYNILFKIIKYYSKNVNFWIFQTYNTKELFINQLNNKVVPNTLLLPFFENTFKVKNNNIKEKNTFFYPTSNSNHKNNSLLINVFIEFYIINKIGKLFLTLKEDDFLNKDLREKVSKNLIPIYFIGKLDQSEMHKYYLNSEFVIHPSSTESFGIVLIESYMMGCKLIAPQLAYVNEVIIPSISYEENTFDNIYNSLLNATNNIVNKPILLIENKLSSLLKLIQ